MGSNLHLCCSNCFLRVCFYHDYDVTDFDDHGDNDDEVDIDDYDKNGEYVHHIDDNDDDGISGLPRVMRRLKAA